MTSERWHEITGLFQAALGRDRAERQSFVALRCGDDDDLRREVEGMLAAHDQASDRDAPWPPVDGVPATLAHYEIVRKLGSGGMGDVFLARDTRLDRDVALKILPPELADDAERRARFTREAKAVAALNHPNIVTLHSVEDAHGVRFITMELVKGRPLADILSSDSIALSRFFEIAVQLADALSAAHQHGITHRDLKPSNLMIADDGRLKVLDFGLAKALPSSSGRGETMDTQSATLQGQLLGTPAYMSPEQAEGKSVDHRTDIFSLGIVFYEMLTGERPFRGDNAVAVASAILRDQPAPLSEIRPSVPQRLERIVARCLAKNPADRYQSAIDLRHDLEEARGEPSAPLPSRAARRMGRRAALSIAAAAAAVAAVIAWRDWGGAATTTRAIAVLPFTNVAGDVDLEYLCDGITENLIQQISRLQSLRVIARTTVFNFKGKAVDPREVGRQLGVDAILTGSVSKQGSRLRISAELVDVGTGVRLWGNTYDRTATELMQVQDEIATAIVDQGVRVRPSGDERRALTSHPTTDAQAYEWYLRARHAIMRNNEADMLQARELLVRATNKDPQFAQAHGALAATFVVGAVDGFERPTEAFPESQRIARRALAIDPQQPLARSGLAGAAFFFDWDWPTVQREWSSLDETAGNSDLPLQEHHVSALSRWVLAGPAEALRVVRRLRELDSISPSYAMFEADLLFHVGQLDASAALYQKVLEGEEIPDALSGLAEVRRAQGRFDEAIDALGRAHQSIGDTFLDDALATARGEAGYRLLEMTTAKHDLAVMRERESKEYVSPLDFARAYAILGNREETFTFMEKAFADRSPGLVFLKVDRAWDGVRDDPRFLDAIRRVGLP